MGRDQLVGVVPSLRQLGYWLAVVEEGSFTAAAKRLSVSQPTLSHQIRALERQLGGKLLDRRPGGVYPTVAGRALRPEAQATLLSAQRAARAARKALGVEAGVLEIATFPGLATGNLLAPICRWHQTHPNVAVRLIEFRDRSDLERSMQFGTADVAVGIAPSGWMGPQCVLGWNEFVVVLPPDDPLADGGVVALERLAARGWVLYDRDYGLTVLVNEACARAGFRPRGIIETSQAEAAARLAGAGVGPALVPFANVPGELAGLTHTVEPRIVWPVSAYTRVSWAPTVSAFLELATNHKWASPDGAVRLHL